VSLVRAMQFSPLGGGKSKNSCGTKILAGPDGRVSSPVAVNDVPAAIGQLSRTAA
jgi:hypothetical protein